MKSVRAGFVFVVLAVSSSLFTQDEEAEVNRTPLCKLRIWIGWPIRASGFRTLTARIRCVAQAACPS